MIMLSELLGFTLRDKNQSSIKIADLAVVLLEEDYPLVTSLLFIGNDKKLMRLSWDSVTDFDLKHRQIKVEDFADAEEYLAGAVKNEALLRRDVLDALVLDLQGRTVTRANDLALEEEDGKLRLHSVDAKFEGMLRRITRGLYRHINKEKLYDWKYVEFLRGNPDAAENGDGYNMQIARMPAGEIAQLSTFLPYLHAAELLTLLPDEKAADVLEAMPIERQVQVIEEFDEDEAIELLTLMSPDLATDLLRRLHLPTMKKFLELLPREQGSRVLELLNYPEDSVGGVMVNDIIYLCTDITVREAREKLRERLKEPDFVDILFLINDEEQRYLRGIITLRQLITEKDEWKLEDIMDPYVETLNPFDPARTAAYRIIDTQRQAMPVTGKENKLLGAMTIDAAFAQVAQVSGVRGMRIFS